MFVQNPKALCTAHVSVCVCGGGVVGGKCVKLCTAHESV